MRVSLLVHLIFSLVGCCLVELLLHPLLSELRVVAVLLNAAAPGLPLRKKIVLVILEIYSK